MPLQKDGWYNLIGSMLCSGFVSCRNLDLSWSCILNSFYISIIIWLHLFVSLFIEITWKTCLSGCVTAGNWKCWMSATIRYVSCLPGKSCRPGAQCGTDKQFKNKCWLSVWLVPVTVRAVLSFVWFYFYLVGCHHASSFHPVFLLLLSCRESSAFEL